MKVDSSTRNGPRALQDGVARSQGDSSGAVSAANTGNAATSGAAGSALSAIGSGSLQGDASVSLSSLSSTLRSLAASGAADIDVAHVQSIKDAISNGEPGQQVRVRTGNGQIVTGVVKDAGTVQVQI